MFVKPRKNLFEQMRVLREAPGDDAADILNTGVDNNTTNTDPNAGEAESTGDNDLDVNVDLNLDDPGTGGDDDNPAGGDNNDDGGLDDLGDPTTDTGDTSGGDNSNPKEEVKKGNTDLFASLTAEEQSIKIMELKKLYNDLYVSLDDLIDKLNNDVSMEDVNPKITVRINSQMEELRRLLQDYIINSFPIKTYYENDVNYSIFLSMFTTLRGVFDEIYKDKQRNADKK